MGSADGLRPARAALSGEGGSPVRRSTHPSSLLVVAVEDRLLGLRRLVEGRLRVLAFDQDAVDHVDGDLALAGLVHEKRRRGVVETLQERTVDRHLKDRKSTRLNSSH